MRPDWDSIPEPLWPFVAHGVEWQTRSKSQWQGTAPFSERTGKFYVNPKTGQWDEKQLGLSGNVYGFLAKMAEWYEGQFNARARRRLAKLRGLPEEAFDGWGIGWDPGRECYTLPVWSHKGTCRDVKRWFPETGIMLNTKGMKPDLFNARALANAATGSTVWWAEGEWDAVALRWFLGQLKAEEAGGAVVGLPGAGVFRREWLEIPRIGGMLHRWCLDNDAAGDRGAAKIAPLVGAAGWKSEWLNWPRGWATGWDVRDYVCYALEHDVPLKKSWKKFISLFESTHRADPAAGEKREGETEFVSDREAPTFQQLVGEYEKYLHMDAEMVLALKFILAIVYSQSLGTKEPLWAYLVAAAGGGKTALLSCLGAYRRAVFRSTVTPHALVSGFKADTDPSLLPQLSGKTFVIKDFTTTLSGPEFDFERVMAILRDAFDGEFSQSYGNAVVREYKRLHFSLVAGVTPAIHAKPMAMMGERFLKFCMRTGDVTARMERLVASMRNPMADAEMEKTLGDATNKFLSRRLNEADVPLPGGEFLRRLAALSQVLAILRAQVARDARDRDAVLFRPEPEVGTRPYRQFVKLSRAAVFMLRKKEFDDEVLRLVERVAMDSCVGFNVDVVLTLLQRDRTNGEAEGLTTRELAERCRLGYNTVARSLQDLETLGAVRKGERKEKAVGRPPVVWRVGGELARAWKAAKIGEPL
jgi:hypothetical protein